jgi:signal transduction histidine kinase
LRRLAKNHLHDNSEAKRIQRIKRNVDRLKDVQAIGQAMVAPPEYQPDNLQADKAINEILDDIRQKSSQRSVSLISQLEPIETDIIDPRGLGRILQTLVKNAVENSPDEAQVVISLSKISSGIRLRVEGL